MSWPRLLAVTVCACLAQTPAVAVQPHAAADTVLAAWIRSVSAQQPGLQATRAALDSAVARGRAAGRPLFNPELELDYEHSEAETKTASISQTVDWSGKRSARASVAGYQLERAREEFRAAQLDMATALLQALADCHTTAAAVRISERQATLMSRFVRLAQRRRKAGDLGQVELDLAHLAEAEALFGLAQAREEQIDAQRALGELTGSEAVNLPPLAATLPDIDAGALDTENLLDGLPSQRATQARVAAARAALQLVRHEQRPDPTVALRAGREDSATLAGVTLSLPLFVRNDFAAEVDAASAELVQAQREALRQRQQARADLLAAAQTFRNARQAWHDWQAGGASRLDQRADLLGRLWQSGELNTTDYLVQLKQLLDTEHAAIRQHGRMWRAWASWLAASGGAGEWLELEGYAQ